MRGKIRTVSDQVEAMFSTMETQLKGELSENIGTVLDVIRGIAEQTNLLALNAATQRGSKQVK